VARRARAALTGGGGRATAVVVDATIPESVEAARREVEARLGPVDILINAPGVNSSTPFFDIDLAEWHAILDANLTSVFVACQVFARAMVDRGQGGSIINISSASSGPPLSRVLTYSVAKAGLNNLTQYLARELAPHRIRVNAIAPASSRPNRTAGSSRRIACAPSSGTRRPPGWASRASWSEPRSGSHRSGRRGS
jgi:NAD(P)-dependent dehydrogenase (short-subunit alcohol dehydrogenase family)